jgi:hypothetical protein
MTNTTVDLTTWTPVQIDTELARLWGEIDKTENHIDTYKAYLAEEEKSGQRIKWSGGRSTAETLAEYRAKLVELWTEVEPYQDEFARRGGWLRYFLVTNNNGHVHREMHCSTCFITTRYHWLVSLADCDENEMIEEWGELACTVCFPDAPTNPNYHRPSKRDQVEREARAAEKAEREAKKAQKNLRPEEQFRGRWGMVTTVAAAKQAIRDAIELANYGGPGDRHPDADKAEAEAVKATEVLLARGVPQAELDKIVANAKKKNGVK